MHLPKSRCSRSCEMCVLCVSGLSRAGSCWVPEAHVNQIEINPWLYRCCSLIGYGHTAHWRCSSSCVRQEDNHRLFPIGGGSDAGNLDSVTGGEAGGMPPSPTSHTHHAHHGTPTPMPQSAIAPLHDTTVQSYRGLKQGQTLENQQLSDLAAKHNRTAAQVCDTAVVAGEWLVSGW